jgi:hypothetical protein
LKKDRTEGLNCSSLFFYQVDPSKRQPIERKQTKT